MPIAITYDRFGDPDVLTVTEVPVPEPEPGQVRVKVAATGVNPADWKLRRGLLGGEPPTEPRITGIDFAGTIDAFGGQVDGFTGGERVVGQSPTGAAAEYVTIDPGALVVVPDQVDLITAAAIPVAGEAAIRALRLSGVQRGDTLLVHAATGGVGSFLTQLAVADGVTVVGTTSDANADFLRSLGATAVAYGEGWEERVREVAITGVDAVVDVAGTGVIDGSLGLVKPGGRVVSLADAGATAAGAVYSDGSEAGFERALVEAVAAVATGTVEVPVIKTFPLVGTAEAQRFSETGHVRGKIVITVP
ncbi:NADP-dependent oxidoreductase [Nakamurella leprariae]|uniref:NADP-dependent oxidoreductase n=1 Tax=Nakamurella leprariae TaxID=2803911 RepID=A0A938YJT0_9ACTN|nr:NADP-dependent oxidoreductase [Nakamurella leprariae]MBM9469582.1 NADP-dependent oxidoreductase [Nakamurella leprariae]